jgi:sulfite exporter TauE/SafE
MHSELVLLLFTAVTISCVHTFSGPDHYLPFVALSRSKGWSRPRTIGWTVVCGIGHVGSSVLLGLIGIAIGFSLAKLSWFEGIRGGFAAWALLLFGLGYTLWGLYQAKLNKPHKHFDINDDGAMYVFEHRHGEVVAPQDRYPVTPWVMFFIFAMGPSEPMIPLLSYPAAQHSWTGITAMIVVYVIATVATMVLMVTLGLYGIAFFKTSKLERYVHAIGGIVILICGCGMVFLGW